MKIIAFLALNALCLSALNTFAGDDPKNNPFKETLSSVPAAELPAKAADLVLAAKRHSREATTISVVKASVQLNPAAAPAIVGAIARAVPDMAAVAASVAAAEAAKLAPS